MLLSAQIPISAVIMSRSHARRYFFPDDDDDEAYFQVKKPSQESQLGPGFVIGSVDANARVAHLEHSVRFLQEQHRLMLSGLHNEIEALRERNRDLQFQLIFNKESTKSTQTAEETVENPEETSLKRECVRLEREASAARGEARAAEGRALQLQRVIDTQTLKLRDLELKSELSSSATEAEAAEESRGELRARLVEAERLVRRLRADADRQRRELQCMKNSLHASIRASQLESYGYQNTYSFPTLQHSPTEYWREPVRDPDCIRAPGRGRARRPLTLPELTAQQVQRATVYANTHARPRANFEQRDRRRSQHNESANRSPDENTVSQGEASRPRARRPHRKHAPDHT